VDGSKPGVIAFFGTTEFARGVWAGVMLDVPEGKNNGRVAGVQYFECEPLHGLFTRPQKLTPVAKDHVQSSARQETTMRAPSQPRSDQSTPIDPAQALRDKLKIRDRVHKTNHPHCSLCSVIDLSNVRAGVQAHLLSTDAYISLLIEDPRSVLLASHPGYSFL